MLGSWSDIQTFFANYRSHDENCNFLYEEGDIFLFLSCSIKIGGKSKKTFEIWLTFQDYSIVFML